MAIVVRTRLFLLSYIAVAGRNPLWVSLACAMGAWLLAALLLQLLPAQPIAGVFMFIVATGLCWRMARGASCLSP